MIKGNFADEKIIQLRKTYQKSRMEYDITVDQVWIRGNWVSFTSISIFDGTVTIWIPSEFAVLPERVAKFQYASLYRPPVLYTSPNCSENLGYHLLDKGERELESSIQQMKEVILLHAPETVIYETGKFHTDGAEGRWFEYKNFTLNDETYHLQFLVCSKQYLLVGGFHCRMKFYDEWKTPILNSLEHIALQ